ncbi:MAG: virginiamycin B lyase family protein, partial [Ardenticatenaceae bacterium]
MVRNAPTLADDPVLIVEYSLPLEVDYPHNIATGSDGNLWFTYGGGIGRITPQGAVLSYQTRRSQGNGTITAGPEGDANVWYTAYDFKDGEAIIGRITPAGKITEFGWPSSGIPSDIIAGPDGNLWFTSLEGIGRMMPNGAYTMFGVPAGDITAGPDRNLWFIHGSLT